MSVASSSLPTATDDEDTAMMTLPTVRRPAPCRAAPRPDAPTIAIVSASVGAGHDGAAAELERRLTAGGHTVVRHDFLDLLPGPLGRLLRAGYAAELKAAPRTWDWVLRVAGRPGGARGASALAGRLAAAGTLRALTDGPAAPDAVVTTYPLAAQTLGLLRADGHLTVPVITYLTDLSVHRMWVSAHVDTHIALHPVAAAQAGAEGARDVRVDRAAVPPAFAPAATSAGRARARAAFGLPAAAPLALVAAGSWGVGAVAATAADLAAGPAVPVVACGHNAALTRRLAGRRDVVALGWVDDMPELMRACDVLVQNAGGLTSLEGLASGLPVLTHRPLPGHGTTNAAALDAAGLARWVRDPTDLPGAVAAALRAHDIGAVPGLPPGGDPALTIAARAIAARAVAARAAHAHRAGTAGLRAVA